MQILLGKLAIPQTSGGRVTIKVGSCDKGCESDMG